jgi:hypothetical protein
VMSLVANLFAPVFLLLPHGIMPGLY